MMSCSTRTYLFRSPPLPEIKLRPSWLLAQELLEEHLYDGKRVDLDADSPIWHAEGKPYIIAIKKNDEGEEGRKAQATSSG